MNIKSFKTSWGSHIAPSVQTKVIKRINQGDNCYTIIEEEIRDLLDEHCDVQEEAWEIYSNCEELNEQQLA